MKTPHYTSSSRVCSWSRFQVTHQLLHTLGAAHERRFIFYVSKEKLFIAKKRNWKEFDNCAVAMELGMWWQTELKCWNQIWTNESPRYTIIVCPCYVWWLGMQSKIPAFAEEFTFFHRKVGQHSPRMTPSRLWPLLTKVNVGSVHKQGTL